MQKFFHEKMEEKFLLLTTLDKKTFYKELADKYSFKEQNTLTDEKYFIDPKTSFSYLLYFLNKYQNKIFLVENELTKSLCNTDVKVKMRDILPPFRTFIIYFNNSSFMIHDVVDGVPYDVPLKYIFVELFKFSDKERKNFLCLRFFIGFTIGNENNIDNWYNTGFNENINIYEDDSEVFYNHENPLLTLKDRNNDRATNKSIDDVANFIISFILYYNLSQKKQIEIIKPHNGFSHISTLKNKKKIRRLEKILQDETKHSVYYLGRGYRIKYESKGGIGTKLEHKILVRGHFRHQWCGSKIDDKGNKRFGEYQKVVWIEPFFKGINLENKDGGTLYKVSD